MKAFKPSLPAQGAKPQKTRFLGSLMRVADIKYPSKSFPLGPGWSQLLAAPTRPKIALFTPGHSTAPQLDLHSALLLLKASVLDTPRPVITVARGSVSQQNTTNFATFQQ